MRIFTAGLATETNSFSPLPTGLETFRIGDEGSSLVSHVAEQATSNGWTHLRGPVADAPPGAPVPATVYEKLRDQVLGAARAALPLDIVLLDLHGGMIAERYDDPEGNLLSRMRAVVGDKAIVGALLDPHAHFSPAMLTPTQFLCFYKENPHTDIAARGHDLLRLASDAATGRTKPTTAAFDCRMADVFQTNREPMRAFVERIRALEGRDGVLDISIVHGFRRGDVPLMGTHVVVTTDDAPAKAAALAEALGRELYAMRGHLAQPTTALAEAVTTVVSRKGPTLLADLADNPGGGAPGDSTYILRALLDAGVRDIALGYLVDPVALAFARDAGVGAELSMRIGGKACALSGAPIDLDVHVTGVRENAGLPSVGVNFGPAACVRANGIDIVLIGERIQAYTAELFRDFDIDLEAKQAIVVKSAQHYRAWFDPHLVVDDIVVDGPGVCAADWRSLPFARVRRTIWPFVDDPWSSDVNVRA